MENENNYNKNYYEKNKEKMKKQIAITSAKMRVRNMLSKLNNKEYIRIPCEKIEKYGIKKTDDGKYYI
jgi:hypothetical protein